MKLFTIQIEEESINPSKIIWQHLVQLKAKDEHHLKQVIMDYLATARQFVIAPDIASSLPMKRYDTSTKTPMKNVWCYTWFGSNGHMFDSDAIETVQ